MDLASILATQLATSLDTLNHISPIQNYGGEDVPQ